MRNRMKRIIAIVLALLLVLGMLPGAALADPPAGACSGKDAADRNNGQHFWDAVGKQAASCTEGEGSYLRGSRQTAPRMQPLRKGRDGDDSRPGPQMGQRCGDEACLLYGGGREDLYLPE